MVKQVTGKLKLFLANPASAKFAFNRRLYNLINLTTPILRSKKVKCNICGWEGYRFSAIAGASYVRYNAICPVCGSAERNRALIEYMNKRGDFSKKGIKCLDIGPTRGFRAYFETQGRNYISIDFDSDLAMIKMDTTQLGFPDNTFAFIICSHVLEHVKDDLQAIKEMYRILGSRGVCYIMVPFNKNRTNTIEYERPNPLDPVHLRSYGLDVMNRIKSIGFRVEKIDLVSELNKEDVNRYGLGTEEICFSCTKGKSHHSKLGIKYEL